MDLHNIRETYNFDSLDIDKVQQNPLDQFHQWFEDYKSLGIKDFNAMAIATVMDGVPQNRIVLLKEIREQGFVFYTNYESAKGKALAQNNVISALFFWREQERQIRVTGYVEKIDTDQSEEYFNSRPYLSQIGAAASDQSSPIESRAALEEKFDAFCAQYPEGDRVPMPESWGGYLIVPTAIEFWQGRSGRLHDRLLFTKKEEGWDIGRLQP